MQKFFIRGKNVLPKLCQNAFFDLLDNIAQAVHKCFALEVQRHIQAKLVVSPFLSLVKKNLLVRKFFAVIAIFPHHRDALCVRRLSGRHRASVSEAASFSLHPVVTTMASTPGWRAKQCQSVFRNSVRET